MTATIPSHSRSSPQMMALFGLAIAASAGQASASYINTTAGGPLRPGVYGRIEIGTAPAPPLLYPKPVVASGEVLPTSVKPVYLYVPPGQARKWPKHCEKYAACALPVYFVRMDDNPGKLGKWKVRNEFAGRNDATAALRAMGGPPASRH